MDINFQVRVNGMQHHITRYNRERNFSTYESAVTYFQEMCEMILDEVPQITHEPNVATEQSAGGLGYDYRIELNFINQ